MNITDAASIVYGGHGPNSLLYAVISQLERQITNLDAQGIDTSLLRQHLQSVQGALDAQQP